MIPAQVQQSVRKKFLDLKDELDERARRLWAATEATALGHGGIAAVARAIGMSRTTIRQGVTELKRPVRPQSSDEPRRIRRLGAGRKRRQDEDPELVPALERLIEPTTRGDPESPLRWTCKSTRKLAEELRHQGHKTSHMGVSRLLHELGFSLQGTRKTLEGKAHPDRDEQFHHISEHVTDFQERLQPVVSVDCKKKELVGPYANKGREWQPKGTPEQVKVHDFIDRQLGKAIPYGVYDLTHNNGWVSVGVDRETAQFAVETLRRWWEEMGKRRYPNATEVLITADGGGANGSRLRLWKVELQRFANETGLTVHVCHLPPGTSKWNKIEHRMFSHISQNWRGRPLTSLSVIVSLIANTTTRCGLQIEAELDENDYPKGIKISNKELGALNLRRNEFHGDWNYALLPWRK